jgi:hypothetical protein
MNSTILCIVYKSKVDDLFKETRVKTDNFFFAIDCAFVCLFNPIHSYAKLYLPNKYSVQPSALKTVYHV